MSQINLEQNSHLPAGRDTETAASPLPAGVRLAINLVGLLLTWAVWMWLAVRDFSPGWYLWMAIGGELALIPLILLARRLLDRQPSLARATWVTGVIHYLVAILLGGAVIAAVRFAMVAPEWSSPLPPWLGLGLMVLSGLALAAGVLNLILKGLGLPLGAELTRQVATSWIYAWTRNPIVLSGLAFLVGIGFWLRSSYFLIWVLALVFPGMLVFLLVYEERELEIRFGPDYLSYKKRTPMLLPRRPEKKPDQKED